MIKKSTFQATITILETLNLHKETKCVFIIMFHTGFHIQWLNIVFHSDVNYNKYPKNDPDESKASTLKPLISDMKKKTNCN